MVLSDFFDLVECDDDDRLERGRPLAAPGNRAHTCTGTTHDAQLAPGRRHGQLHRHPRIPEINQRRDPADVRKSHRQVDGHVARRRAHLHLQPLRRRRARLHL